MPKKKKIIIHFSSQLSQNFKLYTFFSVSTATTIAAIAAVISSVGLQ